MEYYQKQASIIDYQLKQKEIEIAKLAYEEKRFQQNLAMYMPNLQKEDSYKARNIASVIGSQSIEIPKDEIAEPFSRAKNYFLEGNFASSVEILDSIKEKSYADPRGPEITYLLMESYHQLNRYKEASNYIAELLQLYPESNLSGYALIRLGDYYLQEEKASAAKESYRLAIENFSYDKQVVQMAQKNWVVSNVFTIIFITSICKPDSAKTS